MVYFQAVTELSQSGNTISDLKSQMRLVENQTHLLQSELSKSYCLDQVEDLARVAGMVSNTQFVYVKTPSSLVVSRR